MQPIFVIFILQLFDGCSCRFVVTDDFCQRLMLLWKITYQIVSFYWWYADAEIQLTFEAIFVNVIAMLVRPFLWGVYIPPFSLWQFCPFKCLSSDYNYNNLFLRYRLDPQLHDLKRWLAEFELKCSPPINKVYSVQVFNNIFHTVRSDSVITLTAVCMLCSDPTMQNPRRHLTSGAISAERNCISICCKKKKKG